MNLEDAMVRELMDHAGTAALVGTRIYPDIAPQDATTPFVVYKRISTQPQFTQDGPNTLSRPRMEIHSIDDTPAGAKALANQVRFALNGFTGTLGSGGGGVTGTAAFLDNEQSGYEPVRKAFSYRQDYLIWHKEDLS